jgi:hypothetical protein
MVEKWIQAVACQEMINNENQHTAVGVYFSLFLGTGCTTTPETPFIAGRISCAH